MAYYTILFMKIDPMVRYTVIGLNTRTGIDFSVKPTFLVLGELKWTLDLNLNNNSDNCNTLSMYLMNTSI